MIFGYARVSTDDQRLDAQIDALKNAGAERVFSDTISGAKRARPELDRLLDQLRTGDVVLVAKYDRLARSLSDLLDIVASIEATGAGFRSLAEDIDTTTPAGRLIFHVFASIAQFERERIRERTVEGLKAAKAKGRSGEPDRVYRRAKSLEDMNQTGFIGEQRAWKISHEQRKPREPFFRRSASARGAFGA